MAESSRESPNISHFSAIIPQHLSEPDKQALQTVFTSAMSVVDHNRDILRQEIIKICDDDKRISFWDFRIAKESGMRRGERVREIIKIAVHGDYGWIRDSLKNSKLSESIAAFAESKIRDAGVSAFQNQQRGEKGI